MASRPLPDERVGPMISKSAQTFSSIKVRAFARMATDPLHDPPPNRRLSRPGFGASGGGFLGGHQGPSGSADAISATAQLRLKRSEILSIELRGRMI